MIETISRQIDSKIRFSLPAPVGANSCALSSQKRYFFTTHPSTKILIFSNYAACPAYCQDEDSDCHGTCAFLREMKEKGVTPSICPKPDSPPYVAPFCVSSCDIDSDCDIGFKCCSVGCEKSCQRSGTSHFSHKKNFQPGNVGGCLHTISIPLVPAAGQPPLPQNLSANERKNAKSVTLHWTMEGHPGGPLIYIVQSKSHVGKDYNRLLMPQVSHTWGEREKREQFSP